MKKCLCKKIAVFLVSIIFFSCGSTPKSEKTSAENHVQTVYEASEDEAVAISVPKKERTFFSSVSSEVLQLIEDGSPFSINQAYSILRKDNQELSGEEKILLKVGEQIMKLVWPSQRITFTADEVSSQNPYIGAIESAKRGIYDTSTGNSDFLSLALPSLVLVVSKNSENYYEEAKISLNKALELNPESVFVNYLSGICSFKSGNFEESLTYLKKAEAKSPDTSEILFSLSECFYKMQNYEQSLVYAQNLVQKNPVSVPALKLCAESTFQLKKFDECELYVARVLQQEPENAYYVLFRAKILIQKGDYLRAASLLDVYAKSDSENRDYLILRSKVQKDWNKNVTAALNTLEKALSLYPNDNEIILSAAVLAIEMNRKIGGKSAGELVSIILKEDPSNVQALEIQIDEYIQKKQWNEAYSLSSKLLSLSNAPENAVFTHINICLNCGRINEAWEIINPLYEKNPDNEEVLTNYIQVMVASNRKNEALNLINELLANSSSKMKSFLYYQKSFLDLNEDSILVDLRSSLTANPRNKDALFRLYQIYFNKKEYRKAQYYLKQVVALSPSDNSLMELNRELEILLSK